MDEQSFEIEVLGEKYRGHYIKLVESASEVLAALTRDDGKLFGLDTETEPLPKYSSFPKAALSPHLSRIRLLQVFDGRNSCVFDLKYLQGVEHSFNADLIRFLEEGRFIGHNSVFDLQYFLKMGVKKMNIGCTLLLAKILNHATSPVDVGLSLELLVEKVLGIEVNKAAQKSDWSGELTFEQIQYAALDPLYTYLLAEKLAPGLKKYGLERIYKLYKDAQHVVAKMQLNGLAIDVEAHRENIARWREELYVAKEDVLELTGLKKLTGATLASWLDENLDEETLRIWPQTETGRLKTDSHVFADFSHLPIADKFERYQKLDKLLSAFGDRLIAQINPETKRLHASYKIAGARTGRMSCTNPNLQQLPRDKAVRSIFIPSLKENVFVSADFSMIELRTAAEISRDEVMLKAFREGLDLHKLTASRLLNKRIDSVTKEDRQMAKAFNFGLLFGLGKDKFSHYAKKSYGVTVSTNDAVRSIETFRELYGGYREWQLEQSSKCETALFATTPSGKRRKLSKDSYYGSGLNQPIQGAAAEIMLHALIRFSSVCDEYGWRLVNTVHDEITAECKLEDTDKCSAALEESMISGYRDVFPQGITKNLVEAKHGNSWGECK